MRRKSTCRWKCLFYDVNDDDFDDGCLIIYYGDVGDDHYSCAIVTRSTSGEQQPFCLMPHGGNDDAVHEGCLDQDVDTEKHLRRTTTVLPFT